MVKVSWKHKGWWELGVLKHCGVSLAKDKTEKKKGMWLLLIGGIELDQGKVDGGFLVTNLALERQDYVVMGKIIYPRNWQEEQCGVLHLNTYKGTFSSLCKKGISVAQLSSSPRRCADHSYCFVPCLLQELGLAASGVDKFCEWNAIQRELQPARFRKLLSKLPS